MPSLYIAPSLLVWSAVDPHCGRPAGDGYVSIFNTGPIGGPERQRVLQILLIVTFREVCALVRPARLLPLECRLYQCFGNIDHELELERGSQLGVEAQAVIVQLDGGE